MTTFRKWPAIRRASCLLAAALILWGGDALAGCQTLWNGNGNWNNKNNWDCGRAPGSDDDVTINNAITNIGGDATIKSLTINSGGLSDSGNTTLTVLGELTNNSTINAPSLTLIVSKELKNNSGSITVETLAANGEKLTNNAAISATTLTVAGELIHNSGTLRAGTLAFSGSGAQQATFYGTGAVVGNLTVGAGSRVSSSNWSTLTLTGDLSIAGSLSLPNSTLIFAGSAAQATSGNAFAVGTLQINNAAGLTLGQNATASNGLTLTRGVITTGSNILAASKDGNCQSAISGGGATSYVNGQLRLTFPGWNLSCTYPVGDAATYAPITVTFPWFNGIRGGSLTGSTTGSANPNLGTSGIDVGKDVNRYWTLGASGDTLTSLPSSGSYNLSLQFAAADVSSGATVSAMRVGVYSGSAWSSLTGSASGTTATASGLTAFGSYAVGQAGVSIPAPQYEYRMDETAWSGAAGEVADAMGALNGTAAGGATTVTPGKICGAGKFTTTTGYASLGHPNLGVTSQFSVSTWINWQIAPSSGNSWANIFTYNSASAGDSGVFWLQHSQSNGVLEFAVKTANGRQWAQSSAATVQNQWQHVVGVYDGSKIYIYVNGVLSGSTSHSGNVSSPPADAVLTIGRWAYANSPRRFNGWIDETKFFSQALSASQVAGLYANEDAGKNRDGSSRTCASSDPASLNAVDTGAGAVSGKIGTKTAGSGFNLDIHALNAAKSGQDSSFSGNVLVDLLANVNTGTSLDSQNCPTSATALSVGTAALTGGKGTISVPAVADAWRDVRVRLRYPATGSASVTACSADNFAVKPSYLSVVAQDADWASAGTGRTLNVSSTSGAPFHKAGQPFTLIATAYSATNAITGNYNGSPVAGTLDVVTGTVTGTLSAGSFAASGGTAVSNSAAYSEAGSFSVQLQDTAFAAVDASDGTAADCAGYWICSATVTLGRFVPDHFTVTSGSATPGCGSFTYYGQDGAATAFTVTAQNAANGTTRNYAGSLARLDLASYTALGFTATGLPAGTTFSSGASAPSGTWSDGAAGVTATHVVSRPAAAIPVASVTFNAQPTDSDGVTASASTAVGSTGFRYGRVRFGSASGSEVLDLPMSLRAEYWDAGNNAWTFNSADSCTGVSLTFAAVGSTDLTTRTCAWDTGNPGNSGRGCGTAGNAARQFREGGVSGFAGNFNLWLKAPGVGNRGAIDITASVPTWLQYNWTGTSGNPKARATFGIYKSGPVIYQREAF